MDNVDIGFYIWLGFRVLFLMVVAGYALCALDDLLMDLAYGLRRLLRRNRVPPLSRAQLDEKPEKLAAILIPAWDEASVIGKMLLNTSSTLIYQHFHIFVGTYPNDEKTKLEVEKVREVFPNIEVVVTPADGPTNKADCLNWILQGVWLFEKQHDQRFEFFVFHNAQDVVHPMSLRYFNYLIPEHAFVQLPLFPVERDVRGAFASAHLDETAVRQLRDTRARAALGKAIPAAGAGAAFSRETIDDLARQRNNQIFDIASLTDDYMMGLLLRDLKRPTAFLDERIERTVPAKDRVTGRVVEQKVWEPVATREFFPQTFRASVQQKAKWITGLALQGWKAGGRRALELNYGLWRDRKAILASNLSVLGIVCMAFWAGSSAASALSLTRAIPALARPGEAAYLGLWVALALAAWRIGQRMWAVHAVYGPARAWRAAPRLGACLLANAAASLAALPRVIRARRTGRIPAWGRAQHAFPSEQQLRNFHRKLGDLLLERRLITTAQLDQAITQQRETGQKLGEILVEMGALWEEDLVKVLAYQQRQESVEIDPLATPAELLKKVPPELAEQQRIYPLEIRDGILIVASDSLERARKSVALSELLECPVELKWASTPDIQSAIKRGYRRDRPVGMLAGRLGQRLLQDGLITEEDLIRALRKQKRTQQKLGEVLVGMELLNATDLNEALKKL